MKTFPRTRLTVITAIGVACVVTALLFGKPAPAPQKENFPYQFTMRCIPPTQALLNAIANNVPNVQKNIQINGTPQPNGSLVVPAESPCTIDKANSNVTQRVAFATSADLKKFLNNAFPTPTPTSTRSP